MFLHPVDLLLVKAQYIGGVIVLRLRLVLSIRFNHRVDDVLRIIRVGAVKGDGNDVVLFPHVNDQSLAQDVEPIRNSIKGLKILNLGIRQGQCEDRTGSQSFGLGIEEVPAVGVVQGCVPLIGGCRLSRKPGGGTIERRGIKQIDHRQQHHQNRDDADEVALAAQDEIDPLQGDARAWLAR